MNARLQVAHRLVDLGLSIIPLRPRDKRPDGDVLPDGWAAFQGRIATAAELELWFSGERGDQRNIGIVTGQVSGVVVVDSDSDEAERYASTHLLDTAVKVKTAKGVHRYYRHPGDGEIRNAVKIRVNGGRLALDVKSDGGYVVAPGSIHESGHKYHAPIRWPDSLDDLPVFDRAWLPAEEQSPRLDAPVVVPAAVLNDRDRLIHRARAYVARVDPAIQGNGGDVHTFKVCCRLVRGFSLSVTEALEVLIPWNDQCVPPWSQRELIEKLHAADKYGREPVGELAARPASGSVGQRDRGAPVGSPALLGPVVTRLSDVQSERVWWLWRRRLARGKLTLLMGDPGVGKSFITVEIASRVTKGAAWPDAGHVEQAGNVIFLAVEDGIADTIRPRLERAGADLDRVFVFTTIRDEEGERLPNFEQDMAVLEGVIVRLQPTLIVVDPVSSYLGKSDSYKDSEMRRVLAPLAVLAERHKVAVAALIHMTKGSTERKSLYRAIGSIAFTGLARVVLAAGADPEQPDRCYLMPVKQNNCAPAATLAYRIQPDADDEDAPARLEWEGAPVDGIRPDLILGGGLSATDRDQQQDAAEFLRQLLADGRMRADEVFKAGRANGYSDSTLNRSKKRADVTSYKEGFKGVWYWESSAKIVTKITTSGDLTIFEGNRTVSPPESTTSSKIVTPQALTTFVEPSDEDPEVGLV
jgi:hypothetical protein